VAKQAVLAGGAHERHIAFRDNDRPGVMSAGAVRAYLNRWGVSPGKSVAIFCNNDDAHRTARDLQAAGVRVAALIDVRPDAADPARHPRLHRRGRDRHEGPARARGGRHPPRRGRKGDPRRLPRRLGRLEPGRAPHLPHERPARLARGHRGLRARAGRDARASIPRARRTACSPPPAASPTGCAPRPPRSTALGRKRPGGRDPEGRGRRLCAQPFWQVPGKGRAWLDFQNDVTVKDMALAAQENFRSASST
jgi:hypothetical protein